MDARLSVNKKTTKILKEFLANIGKMKTFWGMAKKNTDKLISLIRKQDVSVTFCAQRIILSFNA